MKNALLVQKIEAAAIFVAATYLYVDFGFSLWVFFGCLLLIDISMVGYFFNQKIGALAYNVGHSLFWPVLLLVLHIATANDTLLLFSLIWFAHIGMDRALGYGLKFTNGFAHTHLGDIGKKIGSHPTPNSLLKKRKTR